MEKRLQSLIIPLIIMIVGLPAYAYEDWQDMTSGVPLEYSVKFVPFGGRFTLDSDQTVELTHSSNMGMDSFTLFSDAACENVLMNTNGEEGPGIYNLAAGTYYFYSSSAWGPGQIMYALSGGVSLNITEILPASGSKFNASLNGGYLSLTCDFVIYADTWQIKSSKYNSPLYNLNAAEQGILKSLSIYVKEKVNDLTNQGLDEGDDFTIEIKGIRNAGGDYYDGTGTLSLSYKAAAPVATLTASSLNAAAKNILYSYYYPGDDASLLSFTFSKPFDTGASCLVQPIITGEESYDSPTSGQTLHGPVLELACVATSSAMKLYYEGTPSADNRTVTFDISGFDFGTWNGALGENDAVPGYKLYNIVGADDGLLALGNDPTSPGAYKFQSDYRQFSQATFNAVWTPAAGQHLVAETSVNITTNISDGTGFKHRLRDFEGLKFTAADATTVTVPRAECTFTSNANGNVSVSCATPAVMLEKNNVTVSMVGIVSADGLSYADSTIEADFSPTFTDPSLYITFGSVDISSTASKSQYISSITAVNVYTDLIYDDNYIPTVTCSDPNVVRTIWYVNPNPSTDGDGHKYYVILIGQPIAMAAGNGASVVDEGTTLTISFPAKAFSSNILDATFDAIDYTFTFGTEPDPELPGEFSITLSSPAESEVEAMNDSEFLFTITGTPEHEVLYYILYDNGVATDSRGRLNKTAEPRIWEAYAQNMIYLAGHTYSIVVKGYETVENALKDEDGADVATFNFTGTGKAIEYNHDITASVSPATGTIEPTQSTFTFTFSSPVKVAKGKILLPKTKDGAQDPIVFNPVASNPDANGLSAVWSADLTAAGYNMYKQTYLEILLYGSDADGKLFLNSSEIGADSYYKFGEWYINNGSDKVDIHATSPTPGDIYSLFDKIVVTFDGVTNIQTTWSAQAYLLDSESNEYRLQSDMGNSDETVDWLIPDGWDIASLDYGTYTLVVGSGYYMVEQTTEYPERSNREYRCTFNYTSVPSGCDLNVYTDKTLFRPADIPVTGLYGLYVTVDNATAYQVANGMCATLSYGETNQEIHLSVCGNYLAVQEYLYLESWAASEINVSIPAGYVKATVNGTQLDSRAANVTINLVDNTTYNNMAVIEVTPSFAGISGTPVFHSLREFAISFDGVERAFPNGDELRVAVVNKKDISDVCLVSADNWASCARFDAHYTGNWEDNNYSNEPAFVLSLPVEVSERGNYKLTVADKSFVICPAPAAAAPSRYRSGAMSEYKFSQAMELSFSINPDLTGISEITVDDADIYVVFNLSGVQVMSTSSRDDLAALAPGFYIINGRKVFVK